MSSTKPSGLGARRKQRPSEGSTSNSRNQRRERQTPFVTHRQLKGGQIQVVPNPPSVAYQPWNSLTVVITTKSGSTKVTVSDLVGYILKQTDPTTHGLKTDAVLSLKIHKVRCWNITGNMIALSVEDFSDPAQSKLETDSLCGLVDTGTQLHVPAVGYDLPATHKELILRNGTNKDTDKDIVLFHVMSANTDTVIIYVNILWKFDGPASISSFENTMLEALLDVRSYALDVKTAVEGMREGQKKLGLGKLLINGIETVAPFVLPATAVSTTSSYDRIDDTALERSAIPSDEDES